MSEVNNFLSILSTSQVRDNDGQSAQFFQRKNNAYLTTIQRHCKDTTPRLLTKLQETNSKLNRNSSNTTTTFTHMQENNKQHTQSKFPRILINTENENKKKCSKPGKHGKNFTVQAGCIRGTSLFVNVVAVVPQCLITFFNVSVPCELQTLALGLRSSQKLPRTKTLLDDLQHQHWTFPFQQSSLSKAPRITKEPRTTVRC
jgi:hypothetical protein